MHRHLPNLFFFFAHNFINNYFIIFAFGHPQAFFAVIADFVFVEVAALTIAAVYANFIF